MYSFIVIVPVHPQKPKNVTPEPFFKVRTTNGTKSKALHYCHSKWPRVGRVHLLRHFLHNIYTFSMVMVQAGQCYRKWVWPDIRDVIMQVLGKHKRSRLSTRNVLEWCACKTWCCSYH